MLKRVVSFGLDQPLFLVLLVGLFLAAGVAAFRALPVEAFPDVTDVQTTIVTLVPGHAAEEVEKQVTIPLEIALAGVPHSVRLFSHTQFGLSFLTRSEEHTSELQSLRHLVCRLLLEKKKKITDSVNVCAREAKKPCRFDAAIMYIEP